MEVERGEEGEASSSVLGGGRDPRHFMPRELKTDGATRERGGCA